MKNYLLLFVSFTLLLFAMPKSDSQRSFAQQAALKKDCKYSKHFGKKPCAKKCLKHQMHSSQQKNATGIASDCSQQIYAIIDPLQKEPIAFFKVNPDFVLPHIRKHLSPVLEYNPEPPQLS